MPYFYCFLLQYQFFTSVVHYVGNQFIWVGLPLCGQINCFIVIQYCDSLFSLSNCLTSTGRDDFWPNPLLAVCDTDLRRWLPKDDQDWCSAQIHCQGSAFLWQVLRKCQVICIFIHWAEFWGFGKNLCFQIFSTAWMYCNSKLAWALAKAMGLEGGGMKQMTGRALHPLSLWLLLLLFFLLYS